MRPPPRPPPPRPPGPLPRPPAPRSPPLPRPPPVPAPTASAGQMSCGGVTVDVPTDRVATVLAFACSQLGKPYLWGASGPNAYDCSGFTMASWAKVGVSLPHSSRSQAGVGTSVSQSELRAGDLVFSFSPISHVGIYLGGGRMIAAPSAGDVVKIQSLSVPALHRRDPALNETVTAGPLTARRTSVRTRLPRRLALAGHRRPVRRPARPRGPGGDARRRGRPHPGRPARRRGRGGVGGVRPRRGPPGRAAEPGRRRGRPRPEPGHARADARGAGRRPRRGDVQERRRGPAAVAAGHRQHRPHRLRPALLGMLAQRRAVTLKDVRDADVELQRLREVAQSELEGVQALQADLAQRRADIEARLAGAQDVLAVAEAEAQRQLAIEEARKAAEASRGGGRASTAALPPVGLRPADHADPRAPVRLRLAHPPRLRGPPLPLRHGHHDPVRHAGRGRRRRRRRVRQLERRLRQPHRGAPQRRDDAPPTRTCRSTS